MIGRVGWARSRKNTEERGADGPKGHGRYLKGWLGGGGSVPFCEQFLYILELLCFSEHQKINDVWNSKTNHGSDDQLLKSLNGDTSANCVRHCCSDYHNQRFFALILIIMFHPR